jgi:hypothetical protein
LKNENMIKILKYPEKESMTFNSHSEDH